MQSLAGDLLLQTLAKQPDKSLKKRLYHAIRESIIQGDLPPLSRLPASRDLARQLAVSRNTVLTVYEQLVAEGYIFCRTGNGTFVEKTVPDSYLSVKDPKLHTLSTSLRLPLSQRGMELLNNAGFYPKQWGAFIPGVPDVTAFPHAIFSKILARVTHRPKALQLTYDHQGGSLPLRQALVDYLRVARAVHCQPEQILITEGLHQALDLIIRMLCNPGDNAWVENPGYWGIRNILRISGVNICPVPVDADGMCLPPRLTPSPRLIFVTPSHQYPLGAVMSLARRERLIQLAQAGGSWIVEDDYDSEFRFAGRPFPALQSLKTDAPVIYIGTFSKTLYPALRIGYIVLPPPLVHPLKSAHSELFRAGHLLTQHALAQFIQQEHFASHIRRMRLLYGKRREYLIGLIEQHLGANALNPCNSNAGLHLVLNLPATADDQAIANAAAARGVLVRPLSLYCHHSPQRGLLMGFACVDEIQMNDAFQRLLPCLP